MKTCFKCLTKKSLNEFYKHSGMADGYLSKCKSCARADVLKHRHGEGRERVLVYDRQRARHSKRIEKAKITIAQWISEHPDRRKAQVIVGNALRDGKLVRHACFVCGSKAEAHHPDYSRPLDVMWLCQSHHKETHALISKLEAN